MSLSKKQLIKKIYKVFSVMERPDIGVDDPRHCLSCDETQEEYETLKTLKETQPNNFGFCYMAIESLSEGALNYFMPRLLELAINGEEITEGFTEDTFIRNVLYELVPSEHGDRFQNYSRQEITVITEAINFIHAKFYRDNYEEWCEDFEMMIDVGYNKEIVEHADKALKFWRDKAQST